jgi:hypothetical protein
MPSLGSQQDHGARFQVVRANIARVANLDSISRAAGEPIETGDYFRVHNRGIAVFGENLCSLNGRSRGLINMCAVIAAQVIGQACVLAGQIFEDRQASIRADHESGVVRGKEALPKRMHGDRILRVCGAKTMRGKQVHDAGAGYQQSET